VTVNIPGFRPDAHDQSTRQSISEQQVYNREMIGRWMIYGAWVSLLLLLTFLFSNWLEERRYPNKNLQLVLDNRGIASISLQRNASGHYVAPGIINAIPVTFLLDTGATHVALSQKTATEIGLKRGPATFSMTANGRVTSYLTMLERIELGPIVMRNVRASIIPSMTVDEVLLGMSFLRHLELLQKGDQLIIRIPADYQFE
jgi:aspartyl protease family protein